MPRVPRNAVAAAGSVFHVIARGNNKMRIFHDKEDYAAYLAVLDAMARSFGVSIFHYCLMPNHVHLELRPDGDISAFMQSVQGTYARRYCRKYKHVGHVWSGRFKSKLVDTDAFLYACGNYIEMNPVRAHLVPKPEDWPHSSYKVYAFGKYDPLVTLDPFYPTTGTTDEERQTRYRALVAQTRA